MVELLSGDHVKLTTKGDRWVKDCMSIEDVMSDEKQFLESLGKKFTEAAANKVLGGI